MTTQVETKPVLEDEDDILAFTHQKRKEILKRMMFADDGTPKLPEDPAEKKIVVSVLKDMDASALGRKRIKVDEKAVDQGAGAAALIAHVLQAAAARPPGQTATPEAREVPVLGSEVPTPPMVEGETAVVGSYSESYESFVARTQGGRGSVPGSST